MATGYRPIWGLDDEGYAQHSRTAQDGLRSIAGAWLKHAIFRAPRRELTAEVLAARRSAPEGACSIKLFLCSHRGAMVGEASVFGQAE